jgi:hypothetical protein
VPGKGVFEWVESIEKIDAKRPLARAGWEPPADGRSRQAKTETKS